MEQGLKPVLDREDHRDQWGPRDQPELQGKTGSLEVKVKMVNKEQRGLQDSQGCRERLGPKGKREIRVWVYLGLLGLLDLRDELRPWRAQALMILTAMQRSFEVGLDLLDPPVCPDLLDPPQRVWSLVRLEETDRKENQGCLDPMEEMGSQDLQEREELRVILV